MTEKLYIQLVPPKFAEKREEQHVASKEKEAAESCHGNNSLKTCLVVQSNGTVIGRFKQDSNIDTISHSFSADALKVHQSLRLPFLCSHRCNCGDSQLMTPSCPLVWILLHKNLHIPNNIYNYINHIYIIYTHLQRSYAYILHIHTYLLAHIYGHNVCKYTHRNACIWV